MKFMAVHSKMARAALGLGVRELADLAKVSPDTVARLERGEDLKERTVEAIQKALEAAGVEFTNGGQPGVRMQKTAENAANLTRRIDTIEENLAKSEGPSARTPQGGMRTLERARQADVVTKLKNRRTKLKGHGKK